MSFQELIDTARTLVASDKGLLAMDESNPTCNKRFAKLGVPGTERVGFDDKAGQIARLISRKRLS